MPTMLSNLGEMIKDIGNVHKNRSKNQVYKKSGMFTKEENIYARMSMYGKRLAYDYTIFNIVW